MADDETKSLEIKNEGWLTDEEAKERSPDYLRAFDQLNQLAVSLHQTGVRKSILANAMFNLHAQVFAALRPTDDQVEQIAVMFARAVMALRDFKPEVRQH